MKKAMIAALALLVLSITPFAARAEKQNPNDILQAMSSIQNDNQDFKVTVWVDQDDNTYRIGESINFFFKSNQDGYIHLLDIGTSGKVTLIYPNRYDENNFIKANQTYRLPGYGNFKFNASGPEGKEMVKAIVTKKRVDLVKTEGAFDESVFKSYDDEECAMLLKDINVVLNQTPEKQWTEYEKVINIVQASGPAEVGNSVPPSVETQLPDLEPSQTQVFNTNLWSDKETYRVGEAVKFHFSLNRDAYVSIVSIGTSGKVRLLYPNKYSRDNHCKAGTKYTIPGPNALEMYVADLPEGTETIKLIAAQNQVVFSEKSDDYSKAVYPLIPASVDSIQKDIQVIRKEGRGGKYFDEREIVLNITK